jgi:hypothetical protein
MQLANRHSSTAAKVINVSVLQLQSVSRDYEIQFQPDLF